MSVSCVILDLGGALEIMPETGWARRWEERPGRPLGGVSERMRAVWWPAASVPGRPSGPAGHRPVSS
ncbi:hypothetical protein SAMN05428939_7145 [Streptomyces sp. TLI_105]|nr:hypothetical protein SAMN05428939_7145 [Streptomyces sp. TLI_105]